MKKSREPKENSYKSTGIFLCSCSEEISKTINFENLAGFLGSMPDVRVEPVRHLLCQEPDLSFLAEEIEKNKYQNVIIAACSPQYITKIFEKSFLQKLITPEYFEIINIREGCAWVHSDNPLDALNKTKALFRAALERARRYEKILSQKKVIENKAVV